MSSLINRVALSQPESRPIDSPGKVQGAAQQFESLLLSQILRTERESGNGWLGSADDAGDCAMEFAEQQFASIMAQQGGLGLAKLIAAGLEPRR